MPKQSDPETVPHDKDAKASPQANEPARTGPQVISEYLKTLPAAPGVYLARLTADGEVRTCKIVLAR